MHILTGRQLHLPEQGLQFSKNVDHKDLDDTIPQLVYEGAGLDHLKQIIHPTAATQATMSMCATCHWLESFKPIEATSQEYATVCNMSEP